MPPRRVAGSSRRMGRAAAANGAGDTPVHFTSSCLKISATCSAPVVFAEERRHLPDGIQRAAMLC